MMARSGQYAWTPPAGVQPYPWDAPGDERLALALRPERVLVFHG